jgi:DNA-binding NarL/FixJ family response regulator
MSGKPAIRVVIADDHPVVRDGLRLTIERSAEDIQVVGEADTGREVLALAQDQAVDVYVLDITMPDLNGMEAMRRLLRADADTRVIILSLHDSRGFVEEAIQSGARGYLVKESATRNIVQAIREVHAGNFFLSPAVSSFVVTDYLGRETAPSPPPASRVLTSREREVLQLIAEGLTSKEIAARLGLATNTVRVHRNKLMAKLDIHKETDLVRYAVKQGIAKL